MATRTEGAVTITMLYAVMVAVGEDLWAIDTSGLSQDDAFKLCAELRVHVCTFTWMVVEQNQAELIQLESGTGG